MAFIWKRRHVERYRHRKGMENLSCSSRPYHCNSGDVLWTELIASFLFQTKTANSTVCVCLCVGYRFPAGAAWLFCPPLQGQYLQFILFRKALLSQRLSVSPCLFPLPLLPSACWLSQWLYVSMDEWDQGQLWLVLSARGHPVVAERVTHSVDASSRNRLYKYYMQLFFL